MMGIGQSNNTNIFFMQHFYPMRVKMLHNLIFVLSVVKEGAAFADAHVPYVEWQWNAYNGRRPDREGCNVCYSIVVILHKKRQEKGQIAQEKRKEGFLVPVFFDSPYGYLWGCCILLYNGKFDTLIAENFFGLAI
ncbi:hypothetical protein D7V86_11100 [bacterium D16-51]|nr:hypothetical protein D7V96_11865 [bacterium D16-59]RKI59865.1 hypothetical protein D7V86_11100 [bacterium D16-51]